MGYSNKSITLEPHIHVYNYVDITLEELNHEFEEIKNDGSVWFPSDWEITEEMINHIDLEPDVSSDFERGNLLGFERGFGLKDIIPYIRFDLFTWEGGKNKDVYLPRYKTNGDEYTDEERTKMLEIIKMERSINQD